MKTWKCGHPRTDENSIGMNIPQCLICHDERLVERKASLARRNDTIAALADGGCTAEVIATRFGLKPRTVTDMLSRRNSPPPNPLAADPLFSERALKIAAELAGANVKQLQSNWRSPKQLVHARWAYAAAMRKRGASTPTIGRRLNRDHSTIVYALTQAGYLAARSPEFAEMMAKVDAA